MEPEQDPRPEPMTVPHTANRRTRPALSESAQADVQADENDPARIAPSAEGEVSFAGLPHKVREWLQRELHSLSHRARGR